MEDRLARELAAIGPDPCMRRRNLQRLVPALSKSESRELLARLLRTDYRIDIVALVPAEIRLRVARYLDGPDVPRLFHVSRLWRQIWSQDDQIAPLARRFLPGFLDYTALAARLRPPSQEIISFLEAIHRVQRKSLVLYLHTFSSDRYQVSLTSREEARHTESVLRWGHRDPRYDNHTECERRCRNGRVAVIQSNDVFLDDLRCQKRWRRQLPMSLERGKPRLMTLSEELVVVSVDRNLFIWQWEVDRFDRITLPSSVSTVWVGRKRLFISAGSFANAWTWQHGGRLQSVEVGNMHGLDPDRVAISLAWFHPLIDDVVFALLSPYPEPLDLHQVHVVELCEGQHTRTFTYDASSPKLSCLHWHDWDGFGLHDGARFRETIGDPYSINPYGLQALATLPVDVSDKVSDKVSENLGAFLCFNSITTTFATYTPNHIPSDRAETLVSRLSLGHDHVELVL